MNFRDEMKQKFSVSSNNRTNYRDECIANYESDIEKVTNTIINRIKNGFKEATINNSYFKETFCFKIEKRKKNLIFCLHLGMLNRTKYEERICLKRDDRDRCYLAADKEAMKRIYYSVVDFCKKNSIYNIQISHDPDRWPCVYYVDKYWVKTGRSDASGIDYHDERPWAIDFCLMMYL